MSNFLSQHTASARARLLEELNYMNLDEICTRALDLTPRDVENERFALVRAQERHSNLAAQTRIQALNTASIWSAAARLTAGNTV